METGKYPCTGCGCCCRVVGTLFENAKRVIPEIAGEFPYKWDDNGACEMLVGNKCSVYENRPLLCRIDDLQAHLQIPKDIFYALTADSCNKLIDQFNLSEDFKIKL